MKSKPPSTLKCIDFGGQNVTLTHPSNKWCPSPPVWRIKAVVSWCVGHNFFTIILSALIVG